MHLRQNQAALWSLNILGHDKEHHIAGRNQVSGNGFISHIWREGLDNSLSKIVNSLASHALIHASVKLCQPGTLPRSEGKAVRVTDRRHLQ